MLLKKSAYLFILVACSILLLSSSSEAFTHEFVTDAPAGLDPTSYDDDLDCVLSNAEFFKAVDEWLSSTIDNERFFQVVDAWVLEENLCSQPLSAGATLTQIESKPLSLRTGIYFHSTQAFPSMAVEVYSLSGERIFHGISEGNGIMWDLRDNRGRKVPNGLYFYRLVSVEYGGSFLSGELKKFLVLR